MIEVGALVVRIGKQRLPEAGTRPDTPAEKDSVTIEIPGTSEANTWKLQIKQNGESGDLDGEVMKLFTMA